MAMTEHGSTLEEREAQRRQSIVRVIDRGRRVVGTGFFVAGDLIVTCAHVVREALLDEGQEATIEGGESIEIFPLEAMPDGQDPILATVEGESFRDEDAEDVAFLRLEPGERERLRALLGEVRPLVLASSLGLEGAALRGFAFPRALPSGLPMTAMVVAPFNAPKRGRRFHVSSTNISSGCSGGPLWDERGRVVGMAVSIIVQEEETGRHPDTAFVIATEVLAEACRELALEHVEHGTEPVGEPAQSLRIDNLGERPPVFEGRTEELEQIRQALGSDGTAAVFPAITGLGGVGKNRLALEHALRGDYDVRWWVRAGSVASLQEDLVGLGERLEIVDAPDDIERSADEAEPPSCFRRSSMARRPSCSHNASMS